MRGDSPSAPPNQERCRGAEGRSHIAMLSEQLEAGRTWGLELGCWSLRHPETSQP